MKTVKLNDGIEMQQNIDIFDFSLSDEDMTAIAALDTGKNLFFDHHDAETARMFMDMNTFLQTSKYKKQ